MNDTITNFTSLIYTILVLSFDGAYSAFYYDKPTEEHKSKVLSTTVDNAFLREPRRHRAHLLCKPHLVCAVRQHEIRRRRFP